VDDAAVHSLVARRTGRDGELELDGVRSEFASAPGFLTMMNTNGNIYLGGLPDFDKMTEGRFASGLVGCIQSVAIQGAEVDLVEQLVAGVNLLPCDGDLDYEAGKDTGSAQPPADGDYQPFPVPEDYDYRDFLQQTEDSSGAEQQVAAGTERTPALPELPVPDPADYDFPPNGDYPEEDNGEYDYSYDEDGWADSLQDGWADLTN